MQLSPSTGRVYVIERILSKVAPTFTSRELEILTDVNGLSPAEIVARVQTLIVENHHIHTQQSINLNPASNVMNPRAEAAMSAGLGTRASLGRAGEKYEMGLEAIEQIEVIAAALARQVFNAGFAEIRVGSGAMANLYAFMATCKPGDAIIVPPGDIAGHITHNTDGAAGLYGLRIFQAPVNAQTYTVDVVGLAELAELVKPRLITLGASLNLVPHPIREVRVIADNVGADVLFDAAHACGMFSGKQWPNPLDCGADIMTMSTYKSLGGPPGGLVLTNRNDLADKIDAIAYPGLTANFDVGKSAALAITLTDWLTHGESYARMMCETAAALAACLADEGLLPFTITHDGQQVPTMSHQFALDMDSLFDEGTASGTGESTAGHEAALQLRKANILTSAIGLPGRGGVGLRLGVPEMVRWGLRPQHCVTLARYIAEGLRGNPAAVADQVSAFRRQFKELHYVN
jgi:glycine hydroxymethyltransferase